jgi:hypothetical protein
VVVVIAGSSGGVGTGEGSGVPKGKASGIRRLPIGWVGSSSASPGVSSSWEAAKKIKGARPNAISAMSLNRGGTLTYLARLPASASLSLILFTTL